MKLRHLALGCLVALAAPACADRSPAPEETGAAAEAATATRIYASQDDLDLSFETLGTFEERDGVRALILHATANRYLSNVFSFIPDDGFGQANIISERRLEVVLHEGYELNSVLSGLPLFVTVDTFTGTPTHHVARIVVEPRFYDFLGSSAIWIDENVDPFYVVNGTDNISYRGNAGVAASQLTVTAPDGAPVVTPDGAGNFRLDWSYTALHDAIDPHTDLMSFSATLAGGTVAKKTTRLVARVIDLGLTADDPYLTWPAPGCEPDVYTCYHAQPAGTTDFAACGSYRQVAPCVYARACDVFPAQPLTLTASDASPLEAAQDAWNEGSIGDTVHEITSVAAFTTPACTTTTPTIQAVMEQLSNTDQSQPDPADGTYTDRAGLAQSMFFQSLYGDGPALLASIDAFAGGGDVQAWIYTQGVPCPNCHEFALRAVLFYPASGVVVSLVGHYGYGS